MSYEVRIAPAAQRQYRKLPVDIRKKVGAALAALSEGALRIICTGCFC